MGGSGRNGGLFGIVVAINEDFFLESLNTTSLKKLKKWLQLESETRIKWTSIRPVLLPVVFGVNRQKEHSSTAHTLDYQSECLNIKIAQQYEGFTSKNDLLTNKRETVNESMNILLEYFERIANCQLEHGQMQIDV